MGSSFVYTQADLSVLHDMSEEDLAQVRFNNAQVRAIDQFGAGMRVGFVDAKDEVILTRDKLADVATALGMLFDCSEEKLRQYDNGPPRATGYCPFSLERATDAKEANLFNAFRHFHYQVRLPEDEERMRKEYERFLREDPDGYPRPENVWPVLRNEQETAFFRHAIEGIFGPVMRLGALTALCIELHLDLPPGTIRKMLPGGETTIRLIDYIQRDRWEQMLKGRKMPLSVDQLVWNYEHIDCDLFTFLLRAISNKTGAATQILVTDPETGEQVWQDALAKVEGILITFGHILNRITGGVSAASKHRVPTPEAHDMWRRIATVFFHGPPWLKMYLLPEMLELVGVMGGLRNEILDDNYPHG